MYKRLAKHLDKTRKKLVDACEQLELDYTEVDPYALEEYITQCTHCDIWTTRPVEDLDGNPICSVCLKISGL